MEPARLDDELAAALETLRQWQTKAFQQDRPELAELLHTLQTDMSTHAAQHRLQVGTLRKTMHFLQVLMKSHPHSQRRFARVLHDRLQSDALESQPQSEYEPSL